MTRTYRWTKIDQTMLGDHYHLRADDDCLFLGDYNAGDKWVNKTPQAINQTISNIKKAPSHPQAHYRRRDIKWCGEALAIVEASHPGLRTWVPIPGSKLPDHPDYNPRMIEILDAMKGQSIADVRHLIFQTESTRASHHGNRLSPEELARVLRIDESLSEPPPRHIVLVDDVITAGTHFRVASDLLSARFPQASIHGIFIGRTIHARPDPFEDFE